MTLLVLGLGVALVPGDVPGFSEPQDDQGEMHMKMMR